MRFIKDLKKGILGKPDSVYVWNAIISHIPDKVLLKKDCKILIACCGHATEADLLVKRMIGLGIDIDEIKNKIYLNDLYKVFTKEAKRKGYTNIFKGDFEKFETDETFDVILSNPPYAARSNPSEKAWAVMAEHASKFLKPNGIMSFITPTAWMVKPKGQRFARLTDLFVENNLLHVDSTIENNDVTCYWVMQKTLEKRPTTVITKKGKIEIDYKGQVIAVSKEEQFAVSISNKLIDNTFDRIKDYAYKDMRNHLKLEGLIETGHMAEERSDVFDNEVYYIPSRRYWMPKESVRQTWKLILNLTSYYGRPDQPDDVYNPISKDLGIGINAFGIPAESKEQCENIKSYVFSKLYRFYIEKNRSSNFNLHVRDLPYLGYETKYTDKELYKLFELSEDEIKCVENFINLLDNKEER